MWIRSKIINALIIAIVFTKIENGLAKECDSIDVRYRPEALEKLRNCTVIKGFLRFALMYGTSDNDTTTIDMQYSYPELKEITGSMIVYYVHRLRSFQQLFPNLVVIRGAKLLQNYALGISQVPQLNDVGLISLVAIQRGHVHINRCPMLCFANMIDWDMITQTDGTNIVRQQDGDKCPTRTACRKCRDKKCWSSDHCQKFHDDNLLDSTFKKSCHPLCLGGCTNSTAAGCNVCEGISDDGVCVEKCPSNKFLHSEHFRCYTSQVCSSYRRFIHNGECVEKCPAGFSTTDFKSSVISTTECFPCNLTCPRICDAMDVQYLSDAENLKGCTIINGSLQIRITNQINEKDLQAHLSNIEEIIGYLKIFRTISITSLGFLPRLTKIHGRKLEYEKYALVLYDNQNLVDLWPKENDILIGNGGLFIHSNYKLCTLKMKNFQNRTIHNRTLDMVQKNEVEPSCNPSKLEATYQVTGFDSVTVRWKQLNTSLENGTEFILFYRESGEKISTDSHVKNSCYRDIWTTQVLLPRDLKRDGNYFVHSLRGLKQYTQYAYYIKTFLEKDDNFFSTQSDIKEFTTQPDTPTAPIVSTASKTSTSLTLTWVAAVEDPEQIDYYVVDMFQEVDRKEALDSRDYCVDQLIVVSHDSNVFSSANCCDEPEKPMFEEIWFETRLGKHFRNSLENCPTFQYNATDRSKRGADPAKSPIFTGKEQSPAHIAPNFKQTIHINETTDKTYKIRGLLPFKQYTFQFFACNNIAGCGSYFIHSDRTAPDPAGDSVTLTIGDFDHSTNQLELMFNEPANPNGVTVGYNVNFRKATSQDEGLIACITRVQHEQSAFRMKLNLERTNYKIRVRSMSLGGYGPYTDWKDVEIGEPPRTVKRISVFWYLLCIASMIGIFYTIVKYDEKRRSHSASALIRYEYSDRDQLLVGY